MLLPAEGVYCVVQRGVYKADDCEDATDNGTKLGDEVVQWLDSLGVHH